MKNTNVISTEYGLEILLQPMPGANSISCYGSFPSGSRVERPGEFGLFHLCEHLIFRGSGRFSSNAELMAEFERNGVVTRAMTSRDMLSVGIQAAPDIFPHALDLLLDMIWAARVTEDDFRGEQTIVINELQMDMDDHHIQAKQMLRHSLWGHHHPLGLLLGGTVESVCALRFEQVQQTIEKWFNPANTTLVVAGRFDVYEMRRVIEQAVSRFTPGVKQSRSAPEVLAPVAEVLRPIAAETCYMLLGFRVPEQYSNWSWPLMTLSFALGEGNTSRLFMRVRQEQQLAYDLYSQARECYGGSEFLFYCNPAADRAWEAMKSIEHELATIDTLTDDEIEIAKQRLKSHFSFSLESSEEYAFWLSDRYVSVGEFCPLSTLLEGVAQVTPDQVRELGRAVFDLSQATRVMFAPEPVLQARG